MSDLDAIRERHSEQVKIPYSNMGEPISTGRCRCGKRWPCDAVRLLEEVERGGLFLLGQRIAALEDERADSLSRWGQVREYDKRIAALESKNARIQEAGSRIVAAIGNGLMNGDTYGDDVAAAIRNWDAALDGKEQELGRSV